MFERLSLSEYLFSTFFSDVSSWWITGSTNDKTCLVNFILLLCFWSFTHLRKSAPQSCDWWWGYQFYRSRWLWHCPWSHTHQGGEQGCYPSSFSTNNSSAYENRDRWAVDENRKRNMVDKRGTGSEKIVWGRRKEGRQGKICGCSFNRNPGSDKRLFHFRYFWKKSNNLFQGWHWYGERK